MKAKVEEILGRPVGVTKMANGKWIPEYFNWNSRDPSQFAGDTADEAYDRLATYLEGNREKLPGVQAGARDPGVQ